LHSRPCPEGHGRSRASRPVAGRPTPTSMTPRPRPSPGSTRASHSCRCLGLPAFQLRGGRPAKHQR
jgi:hypothetical protein